MNDYQGNNRATKAATNAESGFTLMETAIALLVLMIAGLGIASLFMFSMRNNVGGSDRALAMAVAQQQLEQLRSVNFDDATLAVGTPDPYTVRSGERDYRIVRRITEETNANGSGKRLKRIAISVTPSASGAKWTSLPVVLVTYRSTLASGAFAVPE